MIAPINAGQIEIGRGRTEGHGRRLKIIGENIKQRGDAQPHGEAEAVHVGSLKSSGQSPKRKLPCLDLMLPRPRLENIRPRLSQGLNREIREIRGKEWKMEGVFPVGFSVFRVFRGCSCRFGSSCGKINREKANEPQRTHRTESDNRKKVIGFIPPLTQRNRLSCPPEKAALDGTCASWPGPGLRGCNLRAGPRRPGFPRADQL